MSQPIPGGLQIAPAVYIFSGAGDPNLLVTVTNSGAINAGVGSLWLRTDAPDTTHALYVCTTAGKVQGPNGEPAVAGVWTPK